MSVKAEEAAPEWRAWVAENLLRGARPEQLVEALVQKELSEEEAQSLVAEIGAMPELLGDGDRASLRRAWAERTRAADGWERRWPRVRVQRALKVLGTFARLEAAGRTGYTRWMEAVATRLVADASALALPGAVVDRLLDWEG